jgi:hypothetical protein
MTFRKFLQLSRTTFDDHTLREEKGGELPYLFDREILARFFFSDRNFTLVDAIGFPHLLA